MEFYSAAQVSIPVLQIILLLLITTLLLLFGRIKLALMTNYLFAFLWCFKVNFTEFTLFGTSHSAWYPFLYLGFGLFFVITTLAGFINRSRQ